MLADTGPLYAPADPSDQFHDRHTGNPAFSGCQRREFHQQREAPSVDRRLRALVDDFLLTITMPWDSAAARRYGALRAQVEGEDKAMRNPDTMIGAHALAPGARRKGLNDPRRRR